MNYRDAAIKAFNEKRWSDALAAAFKTDLSDSLILDWIGYCYSNGCGVARNLIDAVVWFRKAADRGSAWSMNELGRCYENGTGVGEKLSTALEWYRKAANGGNEDAKAALARLGCNDASKTVRVVRPIITRNGDGNDYVAIAKKAFREERWSDGLAAARKTDLTDSFILFYMGYCYGNGCGVEKNYAEALKWYQKSADRGDSDAMRNIGYCYKHGNGVEKNYGTAYNWFKKAADKGNRGAMNALGWCYEEGRGVAKDIGEAKKWYQRAADKGDDGAKKALERLNAKPAGNVKIQEPTANGAYQGDPMKELESMIGLAPVKTEVKKMVKFIEMQKARAASGMKASSVSYHCVFTGNPGTGKTTIARIIARVLKQLGVIKTDKLIETDRSGLVAKYIGQTAVKTNEIIDRALDGVLFIDEAYSLAQGGENDFGREAVDALLKRMEDDRERLVVIIAGYTEPMQKFLSLNPGLKSRFTRYIDFPDYNEHDLTAIFKAIAKSEQYTLGPGVEAAVLERMKDAVQYKDKNFGNGRYARNFYDETIIRMATRFDPSKKNGLQEILVADLPELPVRQKEGPGDDGVVEVPVRIEDVVKELDQLTGLKPVKDEVKKLINMIAVQKKRAEKGLATTTTSNHLVFIGSPGTGKTTVARIVSKVFKALGILKTDKLVETDRSKLCGEYIGETAIKTNKIIDSALDGVLFIDEAYTLAKGGEKDYGREAVDTLLKRMEDERDRLVVIIAGYTNEMKKFLKMNPGLQSRFTRYVDFPDYSADELTSIFWNLAEKNQYTFDDKLLEAVHERMSTELDKRQDSFGNARFVRTFFEKTMEKQSVRVASLQNPSQADLQRLTVSDLPGTSVLDGGLESIDDILKELDELVGIEPVKNEIRKLVFFFKAQNQRKRMGLPVSTASYHCVFSGSPGTGKTTVARFMARAYKALGVTKTSNLVEADRSKLVAEYIGQTALKTNEVVNEALNGVLFIDEAYMLANGGEKDFGREAVDTLLKRMEDDRDRLVVIIAGYTDEMRRFIDMNPGLQSRFTRYIDFPDYSADELAEIFLRMAKKEMYTLSEKARSILQGCMNGALANKTKSFGNARYVRNFFDRVKERQGVRVVSLGNATKAQMMEFLPIDISPDAATDDGTNPYDIIGELSELESAKGLFDCSMVDNRSIVKRCAFQVGERLVEALMKDRGLVGQYPMMISVDVSSALHIGLGASVEHRLHPAELNPETVYNMMMQAGGFCKVDDIGLAKLGTFATEEVRDKIAVFDQAFQAFATEIAKRDEKFFEKDELPKDQVDGFCHLLHRVAYAAFLVGFAVGRDLQQEGSQEIAKNGISVKIDYTHHLNLALAQNSRPLIANLRIRNKTRDKLVNCSLRISSPEKYLIEYVQEFGDIWEDKEVDTGAIPVRFNVEVLRKVESVQAGYLRVEILSEGNVLFKHDYKIEAVAPDHSHDIIRQPDMLAAYVIPHCNVIRQLQSDAANLLGQGTGDPSLNGYQGDCERVAFICRAIFEAIKRKYIRYAECPADFGLPGQKLRLPNEIMQYKLATCIDTTLLFASLAEACNLNPVVVLIHGHAFVGVFLANCHLPRVAVNAPEALKRACHDNVMLMIETTGVCHNVPFEVATSQGQKRLFSVEDDDFEWAVDIAMARQNGVRQLSLGESISPAIPVTVPGDIVTPPLPPNVVDVSPKKTAQPLILDSGLTQGVLPGVIPQPKVQQVMNFNGGLNETHITSIKKPSAVNFDGEKIAAASAWKDVFEALFDKLNAIDPSKFDALPDDANVGKYFMRLEPGKRTGKDYFKLKLGTAGDVRAKELANKNYLWRTDYYFRRLLEQLGVDASRIDVI